MGNAQVAQTEFEVNLAGNLKCSDVDDWFVTAGVTVGNLVEQPELLHCFETFLAWHLHSCQVCREAYHLAKCEEELLD